MFGRVRASPATSLELLESQRSSCKIIKHDSLSIYESTLLKLKQGSHCNPRCNPEDSAMTDAFCVMAIDSSEEAMTAATGCSSVQSTASSNEEANMNMSILHFFSKHKSATHTQNSSENELMAIESGYSSSSSVSVSPVSSN